ncbi:hypothetical protein LTR78_010274 [Recurvomyces mirabilis]|uniref:Uncharacterized protein n=1 Tax=Recurvomyces mirabilis TaxID=574656 RepID=A0AAE0WF44_9PEZI|nr:hypothetical protein LTR78_010274 [Recurvomyces mirabilis]KAK5149656.1 hypothetical protein LTS14_010787 [Recurvomyces mirabilis]
MVNGDDALAEEEIGLDELEAPAPDENPDEQGVYQHENLETIRGRPSSLKTQQAQDSRGQSNATSKWLTQLYIISYLIFFSILGVLARIGLQALTLYPGALIANTDLWANFGGSLLMGILREDRMLFRRHWTEELDKARRNTRNSSRDDDEDEDPRSKEIFDAATASFASTKASIPAYVGLTVGFCGSFTSFASICRDAFLAISNNLDTSAASTTATTGLRRSRPSGDSVMAVLAVLILEVGLSIVALNCGAHLATGLVRTAEKLPVLNISRIMDALVIVLGPGCWLGAIFLAIWPVHDNWRGQALLVRAFPLGTFTANIAGTCILGMAYDLQRSSAGTAVVSCQVFQGIIDGFCGALTTVSTWVLELDTLRLKHAYFYGACTLAVGVGFITAIMGSLSWTQGFHAATCKV